MLRSRFRAPQKTVGGRVWFALVTLLLLPLGGWGQNRSWTTEVVDTAGNFTSLVADQEGNLHISYRVDVGGLVKYGFRPARSSRWFTMVLDSLVGAGAPTKITVDSQGHPHICYTPRAMKYAHWDGHRWSIQEIDPGGGLISYNCSVVVAPDGTPHLSWYQEDSGFLRYAVLESGAWLARTLDRDSLAGKWNSLVLDAQGHPYVSYTKFGPGELRYIHWDGKTWIRSTLDSPEYKPAGGQRGMGVSMVLDSDGNPLISYEADGGLRFAQLRDGKWMIQTVDPTPAVGGWVGYRSSLVLDRRGFPHIAYETFSGLRHAYWDGSQWHAEVIAASAGILYFHSSMAIDRDDTLYISFIDPSDHALKVAIGRETPPQKPAQAEKGGVKAPTTKQ